MDRRIGLSSLAVTKPLQAEKQVALVGVWGSKEKGTKENQWSFRLNKDHKLKKITIDHGDLIYSLVFTTEDGNGQLRDSEKAGGWNGGSIVTEVNFESDEEITSILGTVGVSTGVYAGYTIISSLSFKTNKKIHGLFGKATGIHFEVPWHKGLFAGFYGRCGYYIDAIGVYLKASTEPAAVGLWGTEPSIGPEHQWSFVLDKDHTLSTITINHHGSIIYSLMFTAIDSTGFVQVSYKAGGDHDGSSIMISKFNLSQDEEIVGIDGTLVPLGNAKESRTLSSLSFVTNKTNYGPFGDPTGTRFSVPWNKGSFAGFYGIGGPHIGSIGVYLKATA